MVVTYYHNNVVSVFHFLAIIYFSSSIQVSLMLNVIELMNDKGRVPTTLYTVHTYTCLSLHYILNWMEWNGMEWNGMECNEIVNVS
jgi:hypothetical protein